MKVSINTLKKYVDIDTPNDRLIDLVFKQIGAVEHIDNLEEKYKGILVAKIIDKSDHPKAEKLGLYKLDIGNGKEVQVVAGDKSLKIGDLVPYLAPGVKVPYNTHPEKYDGVITKISLRGVESEGMLGSEKELDISNNNEKVMRLTQDIKVGNTFVNAYNLNDIVIDIENKALANRGDLFGLIHIAREISGLLGKKFNEPDVIYKTINDIKNEFNPNNINTLPIKVDNNAQSTCSRYNAISMSNITVQESPLWLKIELSKVGIRPVNNIVDISNYLMYLTSQPLHAFDYDKIIKKQNTKGGVHIVVRMAHDNEKITLINGKEITLDNTMTVISDENSAIAVAGIMGGLDTEIDNTTKNILIESANFDRYNIRKTSMKLGVFSEAVHRFTKTLDPNITESTLYQTIEYIKQLCPDATVCSPVIDNYLEKYESKTITFSINVLNNHLGTNLKAEDVYRILTNINYNVNIDNNNITVKAPTIRRDILIKEDVFEDIGRHWGYNNIKLELPTRSVNPPKKNILLSTKRKIRDILSTTGLYEVLTYNFVSAKLYKKHNLDINDAYHIKNALSPETEYMRTHILPSLIEKAYENNIRGYNNFGLFEINITHNNKEVDINSLPIERHCLAYVSINNTTSGSPYYIAKEISDRLLSKLSVNNITYELIKDTPYNNLPYWMQKIENMIDTYRSGIVSVNGNIIGFVGELKKSVIRNMRLPENISIAEFDIIKIIEVLGEGKKYVEPSRYPSVTHDYSFEVRKDIKYSSLLEGLKKVLDIEKTDIEISPVDIFSNTNDKKKITLSVSITPNNRTLNNVEIEEIKDKIVKYAKSKGYKIV